MANDDPSLGRAIKEARERQGMSQAKLARALSVEQNVIARLEKGGRPDPRLSTVIAVSEALGIPIDVLVANAGLAAQKQSPDAVYMQQLELAKLAAETRIALAELDESLAKLANPTPRKKTVAKPKRPR